MIQNLQANSAICSGDIVEQFLAVLTNERLLVVASNVVPSNTIIVNIVKNRQTRFSGAINIKFSIIRLLLFLMPSGRPWIIIPSVWCLVSGRHLLTASRPEPSKDILWLQIRAVFTSLEVTESARSPNVWHIILLNEAEDHVILLLTLERDKIHAVLATNVPAIEPVDFPAGQFGHVTAEEVVLAAEEELLRSICAFLCVGQ